MLPNMQEINRLRVTVIRTGMPYVLFENRRVKLIAIVIDILYVTMKTNGKGNEKLMIK